jgi:hypothetical protein
MPVALQIYLVTGGPEFTYIGAGEGLRLVSEVVPVFGTTGLSGRIGRSIMVDGADDEEDETEVRCRREGEDRP